VMQVFGNRDIVDRSRQPPHYRQEVVTMSAALRSGFSFRSQWSGEHSR